MFSIKQLYSKLLEFTRSIRRRNVFKNEAKPQEPWRLKNASVGLYHFSKPSKYLFQWSRLFQAVVSQSGTYLCAKRFHSSECGIHKVEGGCRIDGVGELVLSHDCCYFDSRGRGSEHIQKLADLITAIVLAFDPMDPIESIVGTAAKFVDCKPGELKDVVMKSHVGGPFGGDALADFFRWNPFDKAPRDRDYERWSVVEYLKKKTHEEMDQKYKDQDLGEELLGKLQKKFHEQKLWYSPLCCSPRRFEDGTLNFWINTGRSTNIDGWRTQKEIEAFLQPGVKIIDKARY